MGRINNWCGNHQSWVTIIGSYEIKDSLHADYRPAIGQNIPALSVLWDVHLLFGALLVDFGSLIRSTIDKWQHWLRFAKKKFCWFHSLVRVDSCWQAHVYIAVTFVQGSSHVQRQCLPIDHRSRLHSMRPQRLVHVSKLLSPQRRRREGVVHPSYSRLLCMFDGSVYTGNSVDKVE